jgi:hypothetical protein
MLGILGGIAGLGSLICFIIVLIKQFQDGGVLHGIIGLITCGIWTLIWGWINSGRLNIRNIMLIWTLLWIAAIILNSMSGALSFTSGIGTPTT